MTHSDLLLCAAASSRVELTFRDARELVGAHEHLLEERDALREQLRAADRHAAERDALRGAIRELALDNARIAGVNMAYEVRRESRLLDPRPQPWQAREIEYIRWPARAARDLWRILRARPTTAPATEGHDAS